MAQERSLNSKHDKAALDICLYNVQYPDGHYEQYATNILAEALYASCDKDGFDTSHILEMCGHRSDSNAIPKTQGCFTAKNGKRCPRVTLKGWELQISWKDGTKTCTPLRLAKNSIPDLVAEYAKNARIHKEPAFHWWVPYVLCHKGRIISKVLTRFHKSNRKFGIAIPRNHDEAILFDTENGNHHWRDAIHKEMSNVMIRQGLLLLILQYFLRNVLLATPL